MMLTPPTEPPVGAPAAPVLAATEPVRQSPPAHSALAPMLGMLNLAAIALSLGFSAVLLPNQLTMLDEANKVTNLALITFVSLLIGVFVQPLAGALSDRTRSRWGRRLPWILIGTLVTAASLTGIGFVQSVALILALAIMMQLGSALGASPMAAIVADRYPVTKRGWVSAWVGLGLNVGYALGVFLAGYLAFNLPLAYVTFSAGSALMVIAFVLVARDSSSKGMPVTAFRWSTFLRSFWIDPRKHPDFAWAFVARFLYILGYFVVFNYQFFILMDFLGLELGNANELIALLGIVGIVPAVGASYFTGWLADRLNRRKLFLYIAVVFMVIGYAAQLLLPDIVGQYLMVIFTNIGFGMYMTSDAVLMTQVLPNIEGAAAKDLGILNLATLLPQAVSALVAAFVISNAGGYVGLFAVGIVICILGGIAITPIRGVR